MMNDCMSNDSSCSSDASDEEWIGVEEDCDSYSLETKCLFCSEVLNTPEATFQHCHAQHMFDIVSVSNRMSLNSISYIKLINYIRTKNPEPTEFRGVLIESKPWNGDEFMKPNDPLDPLLTFDFESYMAEVLSQRGDKGETITLPRCDFNEIMEKLATKELDLQNMEETVIRMKKAVHKTFYSDISSNSQKNYNTDCESEKDRFYFSCYDHFAIHHEMLQDKVRTLSYQEAIMNNKGLFIGKKVMDVGCGTAILSMFAAAAGARRVIGIDMSDIIYNAMDIVRENNYDNVVDLFRGRVEDDKCPNEKVDIIISEWMGYFLLFEGMLDSVLYARDKYLAPGGLMFPDHCTLSIAAVSDVGKHQEYVSFWDDVYGFKMTALKREVTKEAYIEVVDSDVICSNPVVVKELNMLTCSPLDTEFSSDFEFVMAKTCAVTAIVGYFECIFEKGLNHKVVLSTSPNAARTHWKQTLFLLPKRVEVSCGEKIVGRLSCRRNRRNPRSLVIKIKFGNQTNQYDLS